ncbi:keratin, type II cytoskeletal 1 [Bacillus rossius redtenbacheri]|uniref:keratin, type II cytoskeletal 1 n=1 Tax=Bacillus rossius redtenbacheri TaxID=93214 RepID=UPI002FDCBCF3
MIAAKMAPLLLAALLLSPPAWADEEDASSVDGCLRKDSISCVQMYVFRQMKSFFDQERIELFGGLSLVREARSSGADTTPAGARSGVDDDDGGEKTVVESQDVEGRESALEYFALGRTSTFFQERSLKWDLSPVANKMAETARGLADSVPAAVRDKLAEIFSDDDDVEGRGKKKKLLKKILPILLAVKLKMATLLGLSYLAIALIAKKAILASLISIAISAYIGIRKLLSQQQQHHGWQPHYEVETYQAHGGGYGGGGGGGGGVAYSSGGFSSYGGGGGGGGGGGFSGGYDSSYSGHGEYGSHSSPVAHTLAYSGQKPVKR